MSQCEKKYHDGVLGLMRAAIAKNRVRVVAKKRILTGLQSRLESTKAAESQQVKGGNDKV